MGMHCDNLSCQECDHALAATIVSKLWEKCDPTELTDQYRLQMGAPVEAIVAEEAQRAFTIFFTGRKDPRFDLKAFWAECEKGKKTNA